MGQPYLPLAQKEKQIVLGTLLGDGSFMKGHNDKHQLSICHSIKQQLYVQWLYVNLPNLRQVHSTGPHIWNTSYYNHKYQEKRTFQATGFTTRQHPFIQQIYSLLKGTNSRKIITREYLNLLDPQGIAIWWCDDGCCNWRARTGTLSTMGLSLKEHEIIQQWFRTIWGIDVKISIWHDNGKPYYTTRFNATNLKRLIKLIKDWVPECMRYKVDLHYVKPSTYNVDFLPTKTVLQTVEGKI